MSVSHNPTHTVNSGNVGPNGAMMVLLKLATVGMLGPTDTVNSRNVVTHTVFSYDGSTHTVNSRNVGPDGAMTVRLDGPKVVCYGGVDQAAVLALAEGTQALHLRGRGLISIILV